MSCRGKVGAAYYLCDSFVSAVQSTLQLLCQLLYETILSLLHLSEHVLFDKHFSIMDVKVLFALAHGRHAVTTSKHKCVLLSCCALLADREAIESEVFNLRQLQH